MTQWDEFHGWMGFRYLDEDKGLTRAFTIGYRLTDVGADPWTRRFNWFKKNHMLSLHGGLEMMKAAVPGLVEGLGLDPSRTVFVPALSSRETEAREKGVLPVVAQHCAAEAGTAFVRDALRKNAHEPLHKAGGAADRYEILEGAGYRAKPIDADSVFVFDDLITRGDTLSHIALAILETSPKARVYGVALGKTERRRYQQERYGVDISNNHVPERWETAWQSGEAEYQARNA